MNEKEYVYEDDWEEESEKNVSEESKGTDEIESETSENIPYMSGNTFSLPNEQAISKVDGGQVSKLIFG